VALLSLTIAFWFKTL